MKWKFLALKLAILAVGLYFARDAFKVQKELLPLRLKSALGLSADEAVVYQAKQAQFKRSAFIAGICLIPLIVFSLMSSLFWLALLAIGGVLVSRYTSWL